MSRSRKKPPPRKPIISKQRETAVPEETNDEDAGVVWVRTMPDINGTFRVAIEFDEDTSIFLSPEQARFHAEYVLIQVAAAEHDALKFRQLTRGADRASAIQVVLDCRKDRPVPLSTNDLTLEPGLTIEGNAFLKVIIKGKATGQWTTADARSHAMRVIEGPYWADLDEEYRRTLVGMVGLDDTTARNAIDGLSTYQDED